MWHIRYTFLGLYWHRTEQHCPFNTLEAFQSPSLDESNVIKLFREYANNYRIGWDDRISRDIYYRTNGHAGLVCLCGKKIQESKTPLHTYEAWIDYASTTLLAVLRTEWATIRFLVENVLANKEAVEFLSYYVLRSTSPIQSSDINLNMLEHLTAEGVLVKLDDTNFTIISPLIRSLLLSAITALTKQGLVPVDMFLLDGNSIIIVPVLLSALKLFDADEESTKSYLESSTLFRDQK